MYGCISLIVGQKRKDIKMMNEVLIYKNSLTNPFIIHILTKRTSIKHRILKFNTQKNYKFNTPATI